jgi:Bax protein
MKKKVNKLFKTYRDQLLHLASLYGITEIKSYARSSKTLTISQLELLLIKNQIKLPENRSSDKAIAKKELKENSIRNAYLAFAIIFLIGSFVTMRPYIKNVVNEVKFTYIAEELKSPIKNKKLKNNKTAKKNNVKESKPDHDNAISLNAQTTSNLFDDLGYNLTAVRAGQKVKPIYLTMMPKDLNALGNTKKKRDLFIKIILPLILDENAKIQDDRKRLFKIVSKNFNTPGEKVWLKRRFKEYKIEDKDLTELKERMDIIPVSIAIAQAANESGWGTSRFALEGNALFGQWTWSNKGITPKDKDSNKNHKVLQFQILKASVRAYKNNLNTHNAYREFREARAQIREDGQKPSGLSLTKYLERYAQTGKKYIRILNDIIEKNELEDFDKAKLLPTKLKKGLSL